MGLLTDYFAATPEQAVACVKRGPLGSSLPHVELKWVEPQVLLGRLWAHAVAAPYDFKEFGGEDFDGTEEDLPDQDLADPDNEGPFVTRIKDRCTASLAAIREDRVLPLAAKWSEAEEWMGSVEPSELAPIVRDLARVARAATAPGRHLYVWLSL